jgi:hypothetical protein
MIMIMIHNSHRCHISMFFTRNIYMGIKQVASTRTLLCFRFYYYIVICPQFVIYCNWPIVEQDCPVRPLDVFRTCYYLLFCICIKKNPVVQVVCELPNQLDTKDHEGPYLQGETNFYHTATAACHHINWKL